MMMEDPTAYSQLPKAPHQQAESNVLPPINGLPMQAQYPQMYNNHGSHPGSVPGSMPQTPITPHTPVQHTSSAPPDAGAYAQAGANSAPPRTLHPPPTYPSNQPGASAIAGPTHNYAHMLPRIGQQPPHLANLMANPGYVNSREPEPTHVVGQQGRRGILPSVAGRPTPNGKMQIPPKNEEGKFPCPHCTKTYLHAKHLKRHMLRHTGDRPYQCKLCKDTFSRSDILKRHFQKCSIRRGHTGDQNHLEGSRNHLKQNQNRHSTGSMGDVPYMNGATSGAEYQQSMPGQYMNPVQDFIAGQDFNNGVQQSLSNRSSRSNSLMRPAEYAVSMGGMPPSMHAYSMPQQTTNPYPAFPVSSAEMAGAGQTRTATANGMSQQMGWAGNYQAPSGQESFMYNQQSAGNDREVKHEPEMMGGESGNAPANLYQNM